MEVRGKEEITRKRGASFMISTCVCGCVCVFYADGFVFIFTDFLKINYVRSSVQIFRSLLVISSQ